MNNLVTKYCKRNNIKAASLSVVIQTRQCFHDEKTSSCQCRQNHFQPYSQMIAHVKSPTVQGWETVLHQTSHWQSSDSLKKSSNWAQIGWKMSNILTGLLHDLGYGGQNHQWKPWEIPIKISYPPKLPNHAFSFSKTHKLFLKSLWNMAMKVQPKLFLGGSYHLTNKKFCHSNLFSKRINMIGRKEG